MIKRLKRMLRRWRLYHVHRLGRDAGGRWQNESLRMLIAHAIAHVPLYRDLYAEAGVDSLQIQSVADLRALPITRKDMYRMRPANELTRNDMAPRSPWKKTSGSTGHPLTILTSSIMRDPFYNDFSCFRFLLDGRAITPWAFNSFRVAHVNVRARPRSTHLFVTITDFQNNIAGTLKRIAAFKPDVIASYTSILLDMARAAAADPTLLPIKPRYCSCFGEMITPAIRAEIESGLGCELFDRYGGTEMGAVASECRVHDGMHVHTESAVIEIVDASGEVLPTGKSGRIILTDLLNFNMPFIRYDIGDSGRIETSPCSCGLDTPRLYLEGRYSAHLTFGSRRVHHLEFDGALDSLMNAVLQYRVVKESEDSLVVQVIPGPLYIDATAETICARMRELVPRVSVRVELVESLPRTPRGKSQIVADLTAA